MKVEFTGIRFVRWLTAVLIMLNSLSTFSDTFGTGPNKFEILFVTVADSGNGDDVGSTGSFFSPYGAVPYVFRIGAYEIPRETVAKANAEGNLEITLADMEFFGGNASTRPATALTWNEAARFVNWLNTSQGYPAAYKFALQPGEPAYDVNADLLLWEPKDAGFDAANLYRNKKARYFLPSEDEWYKAAFYSGANNIYFDYATGSQEKPAPIAGGTEAGTVVFDQPTSQGPAHVQQAGGLSHYGTMGQNGNVWEWIESAYDGSNDQTSELRTMRGGDWTDTETVLRSSFRLEKDPDEDSLANSIGFRVASTPEPRTDQIIRLSVVREDGEGITIRWNGHGTLQSATALSQEWTSIPAATSPYGVATREQSLLFRVVLEPGIP